jgi:hypothetical protein
MLNVKTASADELNERAALLAGEIQANEQENEILQRELNGVYAEIDARRDTPTPRN